MPIGSAVHARTFPLCESLNYREWSGFYAVSSYEAHHEHEYNAIRNASALIDVSPLFKYRLSGRDAVKLVDRVITRDAFKLAVGQVYYTPWCDEHGKVIDDGTVTRLSEDTFRWTAADPSLRWFTQNAIGLDVTIEDISEQVAALALQGPTSGRLLDAVADADIRGLKYFRMTRGTIAGVPVEISRTGYTGDLGYEIWMPWDRAVEVWDALMTGGRPFDIKPAGMLALDVARVEAGLLLIEVDFFSSKKAMIGPQAYSPYEMGLGRLVQLRRTAVRLPRGAGRGATRAGWRSRSPASRSAGPPSKRSTIAAASRRRSPLPHRAPRCRSGTAAAARSAAYDHDVVAGTEEDDRARDDRVAAFRRRVDPRDRNHRRGLPPARPGHRRQDAVLQPRAQDGADRVTGMGPAAKKDVGPDATEAELCAHMQAYLDGQIEAFDALYAAFAGRLRGYLLSQCRDATLADDLLQETFLQIHRSRRTYQPGRPVTPWIYAIARHVYLMKRRSAGRRTRFEERLVADLRASDVRMTLPTRSPKATRCGARCARCRPDQREALLLHSSKAGASSRSPRGSGFA